MTYWFWVQLATNGFGDYTWESPFDSAPSTIHLIIVIRFIFLSSGFIYWFSLQSTLNLTFENLILLNLILQINLNIFWLGHKLGILQTRSFYYSTAERSQFTDKNFARNMNVPFSFMQFLLIIHIHSTRWQYT